jgi:D-glycerate 3-kinase
MPLWPLPDTAALQNERTQRFESLGSAFSKFWRTRFASEPLRATVEGLYLPLVQWLAEQSRRTAGLYVFGIAGSIGAGKTTLARSSAFLLNHWLSPEQGYAVHCSLDDYYWPKAVRDAPNFRVKGYTPEGISNRGPAGTHDLELLLADVAALERLGPGQKRRLPIFDKASDDRRHEGVLVEGPVAILLLDGWFLGARTAVDSSAAAPGLRRAVAEALPRTVTRVTPGGRTPL